VPVLETFLTFGKIGGGVGETVEFYRGEFEIIAVPQILRSAISSGTHPIILVALLFWVPALRAQEGQHAKELCPLCFAIFDGVFWCRGAQLADVASLRDYKVCPERSAPAVFRRGADGLCLDGKIFATASVDFS